MCLVIYDKVIGMMPMIFYLMPDGAIVSI